MIFSEAEQWSSYSVVQDSRQTRRCKISFGTALEIQRNLKRNGLLVNGKLLMNSTVEMEEWGTEFLLFALIGGGMIRTNAYVPFFGFKTEPVC